MKSQEAEQSIKEPRTSIMQIDKFSQQSGGQRISSGASQDTQNARLLLNMKIDLLTGEISEKVGLGTME